MTVLNTIVQKAAAMKLSAQDSDSPMGRRSFRAPISEIYDAARHLDAATSALLAGHRELAAELVLLSKNPRGGE